MKKIFYFTCILFSMISCDSNKLGLGSKAILIKTGDVGNIDQVLDQKVLFTYTVQRPTKSIWVKIDAVRPITKDEYQKLYKTQLTMRTNDLKHYKRYTYAYAKNALGKMEPVKIIRIDKLGERVVKFQCQTHPLSKVLKTKELQKANQKEIRLDIESCPKGL